ncbi:MAG: TetR/AcrR family transcriptional regulator [Rhodospirillaceae bacterium]|jgi:TetR/AcrR family transcriptional repressor of nem operon|nr:TetR/AcrR family transcriptional regulator [Rhodospirillaceae bacterium]MBT3930736.1 TetR/AcrR family transcriptional regulator [Rhodospirillaceae bacterium]MBT4774066.1 TetR/AcrR family transcriptional regulator [Rhodospirillaceae bacterium]MBT5358629.1 TetR/AcrR family transcriptional regulator [Rhodospirillaceae bacterium]MBT5768749.1 TetR/AcrR family transcriptional regulator [Rhodospirillaceae bacterium]
MPRDGTITRDKILDTAEALILDQGYSATSIDKLIAAVGVTKGAFFYHFENKAALAHTLVERYAQADLTLRDGFRARAEKLARDPLQQLLIFIGLYEELMEGFDEPFPGCLFASYLYEANLFDDRTMQIIDDAYRDWRVTLGAMIDTVVETHTPNLPVNPDDLADMFTATIEGAFIMSKTLKEPKLVAAQIALYRDFVELLFKAD